MATITNERDIQLQATIPRLLAVSTNYISIIPSTNTFTTTSTGVIPSSISIKAFKNGILAGTIGWSVSPSVPYSAITDGISIAGADIPVGTSVTFTASLTYLGIVYSAATVITRAANSSIITLEQSAANINKSSGGSFIPANVVFSGKIVDGSNPPATYAGRLKVDTTDDGTTYTNLYTSASDEISYTYTPASTHKAVKVKLYAAGGLTTLLDEKTTSISESGVAGASGNIFYITPSSYVLAKNQNNIFSPTSIIFSAKSKTGSAAAISYLGRFKIYENGSGTASYTSITDESSTTYTPTIGCTSLKCELYLLGGLVTKLDEQGITISQSGSNAVNAVLTNEAHVLPADSSGNIISYAGSETQVYVYEGGVAIPYDEAGYTSGNPSTWKVTSSTVNITTGTKTDSGVYASFSAITNMPSGSETGSITFTITGKSSIGVDFSITKIQKFSKSKQGAQGPSGPSDTSNLLKLNTSNILTGTIVPQDTGGYKVGSISWNSVTGVLTGGTGIAITEWGIIGANSGVPTFTIQAATGAATFLGDITGGSNISITGQGRFSGNDGGYSLHANYSRSSGIGGISCYSVSNFLPAVRAECQAVGGVSMQAISNNSTITALTCDNNVGGVALAVSGRMTMSNTTVVTNLNADMVDGVQATNICSIVPTNTGTCNVFGNGFNIFVTGALASSVRTRGTSNIVYIENISDYRLKEDISDEIYGLEFINLLKPKTYKLRADNKYIRHGFIAQELDTAQTINSDSLAIPNEDGTWGVDYNGLSAPIVKAIQELYSEVQSLKSEITSMQKKLNILESK